MESRAIKSREARASGGRIYSRRPTSLSDRRAPGERAAALAASYCTRRLGGPTTPSRGLALATAAERLLGGATLDVLLMHQFRDDPCDSVACFAEGSLGGS